MGLDPAMGHITLELQRSLRNHAFLRGLTDAHIGSLAALAGEVDFDENDVVLADGERSSAFYLVLTGSVAVELRTPGYVVCIQPVGAGEAFGWSALLEQQDTVFQVRAREHTTALRLDGRRLQSACRADPELGREILLRTLRVVAGRVKATEIRFAEMCGVKV